MKKLSLLTLCLAALVMACGSTEPESGAEEAPGGKSPAEIQASFTQVREMQEAALSGTADLVERADTASKEELEEGMKLLNKAILRGRQEASYMHSVGTDEAVAQRKELRRANVRMSRAYAKLVAHDPNPSPELLQPDFLQTDDDASQ